MSLDIDDAGRVLIDSEDQDILREHRFEEAKPRLAHVAEPRVVGSALAVVVVGDDGASNANLAEQVEPFRPGRIGPDLVNLVDRKCVGAEANRRGAGEGDASALAELRTEPLPHGAVVPVPQRVGWTTGPREDIIGIAEPAEKLLELERGGPSAVPVGGEPDLAPHVFAEIGNGSSGDLVRVLLEAEGRVKKNSVKLRVAHSRDEFLVDRRHRRTGLPGTENGDHARRATVTRAHTTMLRRSNPTVPAP